MSGPKTGSYHVISGTEAVEREYKRARSSAERQLVRQSQLAHMAAQAQAEFGVSIPEATTLKPIPDVDGIWRIVKVQEWTAESTAELNKYEDHLRSAIAEAERARELEELRRREQQASDRTDENLKTGLAHGGDALRTFEGDAPLEDPEVASENRRVELLSDVLGRLDFEADANDRERLRVAIENVVAKISEDSRNLSLALLDDELSSINAKRSTLRERRRERLDLLDLLVGLEGVEADELRIEISSWPIEQNSLDPSFRSRIEAAITADRAEEERMYALKVARDALLELGYEVSDGFETALRAGEIAYAQSPRAAGYAVRVMETEFGTLNFNMVRGESSGANQRTRDHEVEAAWCGDLSGVIGFMREHGVEMDITRQLAAGEVEVMVDSGIPFQSRNQAGASTQDVEHKKPKAMEMRHD